MFRYVPSLAGGIVALIVFFIMTLLQSWQYLKLRQHIVLFVLIGSVCTFDITQRIDYLSRLDD